MEKTDLYRTRATNLIKLTKTGFIYLGESYELPRDKIKFYQQRNLPRRLVSAATKLTPLSDSKNYSLIIATSEDCELHVGISSNFSNYRKFKYIKGYARHKLIKNLNKNQAQYLKAKLETRQDFRQALALANEEIEITSNNS